MVTYTAYKNYLYDFLTNKQFMIKRVKKPFCQHKRLPVFVIVLNRALTEYEKTGDFLQTGLPTLPEGI